MRHPFLRTTAALAGLAMVAAVPASAALAAPNHQRGSIVSVTPVSQLDPGQVKDYLAPVGIYVPEAQLGVDTYRVVYRTVDVHGRHTTASSFVALPQSTDRQWRTAVWLHGTQSYRGDAPSVSDCCDREASVLFAATGYAVTAPDYLGLGEGPGYHPYLDSAAAITSSLDALHATQALAARQGHTLARRVAVSGFSQGANNTMLLGHALQNGVDGGFRLAGLAPISGAYELFDVEWPAALDHQVTAKAATYYLAYFTVAWNRIYHLYDNESTVFKAPYAGTVAGLFDGNHTVDETSNALPATPEDLLQQSYIDQLRHPTGKLAFAAAINDTACQWTPRVPVRMFAAHGDPEAMYANSSQCKTMLHATDVTLTDVGDVDHITSVVLSAPQVAKWFAALP